MSPIHPRFPLVATLLAIVPLAAGCGDRTVESASTTSSSPATPVATTGTPASAPGTIVTDKTGPVASVSYGDAETAFRRGRYQEATDLFAAYAGQHPVNAWGH